MNTLLKIRGTILSLCPFLPRGLVDFIRFFLTQKPFSETKYHPDVAWWYLQSCVKSRFIHGDKELFQQHFHWIHFKYHYACLPLGKFIRLLIKAWILSKLSKFKKKIRKTEVDPKDEFCAKVAKYGGWEYQPFYHEEEGDDIIPDPWELDFVVEPDKEELPLDKKP